MFIQKTKEIPYISIFKTNSGEEFIGKIVEETIVSYTVINPLSMVDTGQGLRFAPFMLMVEPNKGITVPKPIIMGIPASKLEEQYIQAVSPISLPQKSGLIS